MNETMNTLLTRRSVRRYRNDPVPKELLDQIVQAGLYAASGMGRQSALMVVVTNKEVRDQLSNLNRRVMNGPEGSDPFYGAPVVIVVAADRSAGTYLNDGSLALGNMMNAAHSLGLASCWIHRAKEELAFPEGKALMKKLGIPDDYEGIGNLIVGYADGEEPSPAPRKEGRVYFVE